MPTDFYPIGHPNTPWGESERKQWKTKQKVRRSYADEVLSRVKSLSDHFEVREYGALSENPERYPLYCLISEPWIKAKPTVLITGGVHGYETSGVQGALDFAAYHANDYETQFNFVIAPCVSPWGYERINRWNPSAVDPNRSFIEQGPSEEANQLMSLLKGLGDILVHIDLHETTDSDEDEFRPALAARDGKDFEPGEIPDGFYTVGDTPNPQLDFQRAIIESVRKVTHIAPPDSNGKIIGSNVVSEGVILYPMKSLGLCGGMTNCQYGTTTEVYPDSPRATPEICNEAQVAAIRGGLDYVIDQIS
jgi:hypothetical protein